MNKIYSGHETMNSKKKILQDRNVGKAGDKSLKEVLEAIKFIRKDLEKKEEATQEIQNVRIL